MPQLVPLAHRVAAMQRTRVFLAGLVVLVVLALGDLRVAREPLVLLASALLVAVTAGAEAIRRRSGRRGLVLLSGSLVLDGAYLAVVVTATGGAASPLLFLVLLHVVAAVLLLSFRSGVLASLWHATLLVAAHHLDLGLDSSTPSPTTVGIAAGSFVVVAGATAAFASLNERELRRSRRSADALVELGTSLERCRSIVDVVAVGADHLRAGLAHHRAAVLVRNAGSWTGACDAGRGVAHLEVGAADEVLDLSGARPRLAVALDDAALLDRILPGARNVVVVPLAVDNVRLGVVVVECGPARHRLPAHELDRIEQAAHRIALALRTAQLLEQVERLAASDPLTGLPNRRLFDATLDREIARSRRTGTPLALALIDVDRFKAVNDQHGHQVGDEVLCQLATALRDAIRQEDVVARYGGEEFVVLLPGAGEEQAVLVAERLRAAAGGVRRLPITISIGVAVLDPDAGGAGLVARADTALYQAKDAGRDRVVVWRPGQAAIAPSVRA